jgi:hypothetical protein
MTGQGRTFRNGYTGKHRVLRNKIKQAMDLGQVFACWRCGEPIQPGQPWELGHDDVDRSIWRGPEHRGRECPAGGNRATAGRRQPPKRWVL